MEQPGNKITIIVSNDITTDQRMDRICSWLADTGWEVEIAGRELPRSYPLIPKKYKQTRLKLIFTKGPLFYAGLNLRLLFFLLANRPDVIYSVDADTALAGICAKKLTRAKLIFDAHELFSEVPELYNRTVKRVWQWIERLIITRADARITVSESIAGHYLQKYNQPFTVIRNISRSKNYTADAPNEKYILYQGALNKGRGLEQLIEASKSLAIKIKIAGDGDVAQKLKQQVKADNNPNVEFLGKLVPEELDRITVNAWLGFNLLEKQSLSYYYSLSNKTFDYMMAGIPQLIPDFPEYEQLNRKWALGYITVLSCEAIIMAVNQLLDNPDLYSNLKFNAVKASKILTWENEMPGLQKLLML